MKKVIVIDDTKNIRNLLTTCLEVNGFEVLTSSNGIQALELFKNEVFDLIFLDIKMPGISGTEVLKRIRAQNITTPVVIMTAFATVKNAIDCTKLGAVAYLQKPFTAEKVKNILSEMDLFDKEDQTIKNYIKSSEDMINIGKLEEAYELLKKVLSIDPKESKGYYLISKVYKNSGNIELADKFYKIYEILDS